MKKYGKGLIVGKFSPLHKGHEYLINHALELCDKVYVMTYTNPEFAGCEAGKRKRWLNKLFPEIEVLAFTDNIPHNDESDEVQREFASRLCRDKLNIIPDVVFSSEDYGPGFAEYLSRFFGKNIQHIEVDKAREKVPISGTKLRADIHNNRHYVSPFVYSDFVRTVCFLGAESTGKSTLTKIVAELYGTKHVDEYGRTLFEEKEGKLVFDDLLRIAITHIAEEDEKRQYANKYLFVDTSPLTTMFYSNFMFSRIADELKELANRKYDHVFFCQPDFAMVQDGTRQGEEFRKKQHEWYMSELAARNVEYTELSGSIEERVKMLKQVLGEP
mgnify:CR=1 FL=1